MATTPTQSAPKPGDPSPHMALADPVFVFATLRISGERYTYKGVPITTDQARALFHHNRQLVAGIAALSELSIPVRVELEGGES